MMCHAQKCPINHALLSKCVQKFKDNKHNSNLNRFFSIFFNFHFLFESHYLDPSLFKQTFFCKRKLPLFLSFSTLCFFNISFQTCQFFLPIFNHLKIFFLFKIKQHPTLRKKQNEKLFIYFYFFQKLKTYFFCFDKSQIL